MTRLVLASVRNRAVSFSGTFLAVALAATMISGSGLVIWARSQAHVSVPTRLGAASLVVQPPMIVDQGSGPAPNGQAGPAPPPVQLRERPRLPAAVLDQVRAQPGVRSAAGDLAFYAEVVDRHGRPLTGPADTPDQGHPWSAAALTPFVLRAGREPAGSREMAVDAALARRGGLRVGDRTPVLFASGPQQFTVVGIVAPTGGDGLSTQASLFFPDREATALSGVRGQLDAIGVFAEPGVSVQSLQRQLRGGLGQADLDVQTPAALSLQESPAAAFDYDSAMSFLGVLAVIATFIAIFVSANTFAISILQRSREIALLRALGATTRQVRLLIEGESLVVAVVAAAAGCAAGAALATASAPLLSAGGLAPAGFRVPLAPLPLAVAVAASIAVGLLSVVASIRRVGRINPVSALREAAVERSRISPGRLVAGVLTIGVSVLLMVVWGAPGSGVARATWVGLASLVLTVGIALLGPLVVRPLGSLLGRPLEWMTRATGGLARSSTVANARRTASATMPLMLTVTVGCVLLFQQATINHIRVENASRWISADYVVLPSGASGLPGGVAETVARLPGVASAVAATNTVVFLENRSYYTLSGEDALGLDPVRAGGALDFGVRQGSLGDLRGNSIALSAKVARDHGWRSGDRVQVWLADGTPATLRLVAVFRDGIPTTAVLPRDLAARHSREQLDGAVYVSVARGADRSRVGAELQRLGREYPTLGVASRDGYLAQLRTPPSQGELQLYGLIAVLVAFTAVAIVNTLVMATAERTREFALLRLIGTTRAQVTRMVGWEAAITVLMGVGQGTLITVLGLLAFSRTFTGRIDVALEPAAYGLMVTLCVVLAFGASLLPAWLALRARPVRALGGRE
jgi:putative ABC transport system permease protein